MPSINELQGPIWVTLVYVLLYYIFMTHGLRVKVKLFKDYRARGERFDRYFGQDPEMLAADRIQLNLLEHMPAFLVIFWLYAIVVSAYWATWAGAIYVGLRALYPFVLGRELKGGIPLRLLFVTFSAYGVLLLMVVHIVWALLSTTNP
ncbi:MAG: hypothetical protein CMH56_01880 [Myxococcales bacterium]|nr:hypothetical protein [Myxococcales bacterium]|tara:strand:+ start:1632 stop:2075 length:444 start_codon:yes stop_codon:yes gene_type:complete